MPDNLDVIVIGSGIGGLAAAVFLSRGGRRVLVLEQHDQVGGACHTVQVKGFEFDVGGFLLCAIVPTTFDSLFSSTIVTSLRIPGQK